MPILLILVFLCVGCSRQPEASENETLNGLVQPAPAASPSLKERSIDSLRQAAENDQPEAQRELSMRLLFGQGTTADPTEALTWAKRAAMNGDETAALWMGRSALNQPPDRIEACAWFLIAKEGQSPAIQQDASGELDAINLSQKELELATYRAAELKISILRKLK